MFANFRQTALWVALSPTALLGLSCGKTSDTTSDSPSQEASGGQTGGGADSGGTGSSPASGGETSTDCDPTTLSPALEEAARYELSMDEGELAPGDLSTIEVLDVRDAESLLGLECFSSLNTLRLADSTLSDLSPLSLAPELTKLTLVAGAVTDLSPLSALPMLDTLVVSGAPVVDLTPLEDLTALTVLSLAYLEEADVSPVAELEQLESLSLSGTWVAEVAFLSELSQLSELNLIDTAVTTLPPISPAASGVGRADLTGNDFDESTVSDVLPAMCETWCFRYRLPDEDEVMCPADCWGTR